MSAEYAVELGESAAAWLTDHVRPYVLALGYTASEWDRLKPILLAAYGAGGVAALERYGRLLAATKA